MTQTEMERSEVRSLVHAERELPSGATVLVLNTGALITPEGRAMLQALHSRSVGGIRAHLQVLLERGPEKFIKTYFVGYGHKSIGDMAECIMFIEGVSMLCAKAFQDNRLYRGQEASTRYIDFANQRFIDPVGTTLSGDILEYWRRTYMRGLEALGPHLRERFPMGEDEKGDVYNKAIDARAFDTMRGFLPAGASTNLAWTGDFRSVADKLCWLRHHPLKEVQDVALVVEDALVEMHPNGFSNKRYDESEAYYATAMADYYFTGPVAPKRMEFHLFEQGTRLEQVRPLLETRPPKTELPSWIADAVRVDFEFQLDFGSFRDLQRHRAVSQRMPLLSDQLGFEPWYLEELPDGFRRDAEICIREQSEAITGLNVNPETAQYYHAMGNLTSNRLQGDLRALVYLVELRTTRFVHPTLRVKTAWMAEQLERQFGSYGLKIHLDPEPDRFDVKRGEHDIVKVS